MKLATGTLESSNVNAADAMVNMIELARHFDMQVKAMQHRRRERGYFGPAAARLRHDPVDLITESLQDSS